jgi:hypothetical protein
LVLGRLHDARRLVGRAVEFSAGRQGLMAHALHLLGDIATHSDSFDAKPRGMSPLIAHSHYGLSKLYLRTGKREQAREHLTTATTMYREMDMSFWRWT